jgi:hypothetical protein
MTRTVQVPIYPVRIRFILTNREELNRASIDGEVEDGEIEITFHGKPTLSDVVHESFHASSRILHYVGHKPDHLNDEPQAYLLDWIVEAAQKFLK